MSHAISGGGVLVRAVGHDGSYLRRKDASSPAISLLFYSCEAHAGGHGQYICVGWIEQRFRVHCWIGGRWAMSAGAARVAIESAGRENLPALETPLHSLSLHLSPRQAGSSMGSMACIRFGKWSRMMRLHCVPAGLAV